VARIADGVVVGSALVRIVDEQKDGDVVEAVRRKALELTSALRPR
jgi:tryptophan synthase alpha subunit